MKIIESCIFTIATVYFGSIWLAKVWISTGPDSSKLVPLFSL